ncbi:MAG: hypothetical protein AAFO63_06585 [Pseudomonadota bacterium]
MLSPLLFLTGFLAVIATPGLIAQALEDRKARNQAPEQETPHGG